MPVDERKMKALKSEYGDKHGERVYYAMENKGKNSKKKAKGKRPADKSKGMY